MHPAVYRAIGVGIRALERTADAPLAVVDVPLLYETGHAGDFDKVIVTVCSPDAQLEAVLTLLLR